MLVFFLVLSFLIRLSFCDLSANTTYAGYLFAYFTGEGSADGETISFAISSGNDLSQWKELNGGKPSLRSSLGTRGVRDPSIIRAHDGGKFWILGTDLKMNGGGSWSNAVKTGSRAIVIWESTDLRNWGSPRLVTVAPKTVGNTWAPEAIWDPDLNAYAVFWASSLYAAEDTARSRPSYHRIMRATTRDFRSFTEAMVYIDRGWSVIDTTIVYDGAASRYFRFSKDERGNSAGNPDGKFVFEELADSLKGAWRPVAQGIGRGVIQRGEGPTVFRSNDVKNKWHMFIDEFGGRGYVPFETTDIASGKWMMSKNYRLPSRPRHGSVIPMLVVFPLREQDSIQVHRTDIYSI